MNTLFKIALLATAAQALGLDFETPIADLQLAEKCDPEARKAEACKDLDMDVPGDAEECARREARIDKRRANRQMAKKEKAEALVLAETSLDPKLLKAEACMELDMDVPEDAAECAARHARIDRRIARMAERKAAKESHKEKTADLLYLAKMSLDPEVLKVEACMELDLGYEEDAEECAAREARIDRRIERMAEKFAARKDKKDDEAAK